MTLPDEMLRPMGAPPPKQIHTLLDPPKCLCGGEVRRDEVPVEAVRTDYYCEATGKKIGELLVETGEQHPPRPLFDAPPIPEGKRWALLHCGNCGRPLAGTAPAYVGPNQCECPNPVAGVVNSG